MRSVIKFLESMSRRPRALPKMMPPQEEGTITFEKLENTLKMLAPTGLHLFMNQVKPGVTVHVYNADFMRIDCPSLKEFFDRYGEDGSPLS